MGVDRCGGDMMLWGLPQNCVHGRGRGLEEHSMLTDEDCFSEELLVRVFLKPPIGLKKKKYIQVERLKMKMLFFFFVN